MIVLKREIIKLFEPYVKKEEINESKKTIESLFWASGSGSGEVKKFENNFSKYIGCKQTFAVNSGTAALHLSLFALDVKKQDVLIPSLTFVSSAHCAKYNNAEPIFIDIEEDTLNIDIEDLERKISKKSSVVIPVHFGGLPCNLAKLKKIAADFKLTIVEDAAHACGSKYNGKKIGTHSDFVCFSFHPVKNLSMPTGGAISINSKSNYEKIINAGRWCGITNRKGSMYDVENLGWNYYMNEISATIGKIQLKRLNWMNNIRKNIAKKYQKRINVEHKMPFSEDCSYHLYWIRVKNRNEFMKKMLAKGIETGIHYKPVHLMKYYSKNKTKLETCENIWNELVTIPMHVNLTSKHVDRIILNVNEFVK